MKARDSRFRGNDGAEWITWCRSPIRTQPAGPVTKADAQPQRMAPRPAALAASMASCGSGDAAPMGLISVTRTPSARACASVDMASRSYSDPAERRPGIGPHSDLADRLRSLLGQPDSRLIHGQIGVVGAGLANPFLMRFVQRVRDDRPGEAALAQ